VSADPKQTGRYFAIAQVGTEMVMPVAAGAVLDYYMHWTPWGMIVGVVLGFVFGIFHLIVLSNRNDDADNKPPGNSP